MRRACLTRKMQHALLPQPIVRTTIRKRLDVAQTQAKRYDQLLEQGLKSRTDVEQYRVKLAQQQATTEQALGKWEANQNKLLDVTLELANNANAYLEKISKAQVILQRLRAMLLLLRILRRTRTNLLL